jgi:RND family efflux transporter MFP subunit
MIITKKLTHYLPMFVRQPFATTLLLSLLFSFNLTGCDDAKNTSISGPRAGKVTHRVEVIAAEKKSVFLTQTVSGTLEAVTKIRLYNEESGRITKMPYHEGDLVKKGDLLIQLDNAILKTDVDKAKASKEQARVDLSRLKKLLSKKIATEEEVANARTVLDLAIAEEKRQITRLRRTSIKAPIDGLITRRFYEPGDLLAQQSHIQTIIDPTKIRLKASLAERWIPLVEDGQDVTLHIDALGDKTFTAHVKRVHPTISVGTHKGIVEIILDPVPDDAKVGQFVRAEIKLKATDRLVIPVHAIHYEPEGAYVYRVIENENSESTAEKVFFEQGQQFGALSEALTELKINDKIVTRGYLGLRDGKKVDIAIPDQLSGKTAE